MKKLFAIILALSVLSPAAAWAGPAKIEAGLTPESRFYWFDRVAEKIQLVLTLDGAAKAGVLSKIGLERLAEAESIENTETVGRLVSDYLHNQDEAAALAGDNVEILAGLTEDQITAFEQLQALAANASGGVKDKIVKAVSQATRLLKKQAAKLEKLAGRTHGKAAGKAGKIMDKTTARLNRLVGKSTRFGETKDESDTTVADRVRAMKAKHIEVLEGVIEKAPDAAKPALQRILDRQSGEASATVDSTDDELRGKGRRKH